MATDFNALIIDPNNETRARLKMAMKAVSSFSRINAVARPEDGEALLEKDCSIDVIFISGAVDEAAVSRFVRIALSKPTSCEAAIILTLETQTSAAACLSNLVQGIDGFLVEPFSVLQLVDATALAERVKVERRRARFGPALKLLVREIACQLSQVALCKKKKQSAGISQRVLRDMCSVIRNLDPALTEEYYAALIGIFSVLPPPSEREFEPNSYHGASQRIRSNASLNALEKFKETLVA